MKWVSIDFAHINTDLLTNFRSSGGYLFLQFCGGKNVSLQDPDGKLYVKLCQQLGVRPCEDAQEIKK